MGNFNSGRWIVILLVYFFLFFVAVHSVLNAQAAIGVSDNRVSISDPGFKTAVGNQINGEGACTGKTNVVSTFGLIGCKKLDIEEEFFCDQISDCLWQNGTSIFNLTVVNRGCFGTVNATAFNLPPTQKRSTFCDDLNNYTAIDDNVCSTFGCTWLNQTELAQSYDSDNSIVTLWETTKFMLGFNVELGIDARFNFMFAFLFVWLPILMLLIAIYFALPFAH